MIDPTRKIPDEGPRAASLVDGARFEVARLADGRFQILLDRGGHSVLHAGPPDTLRIRLARDADPRDVAVILAVFPPKGPDPVPVPPVDPFPR